MVSSLPKCTEVLSVADSDYKPMPKWFHHLLQFLHVSTLIFVFVHISVYI